MDQKLVYFKNNFTCSDIASKILENVKQLPLWECMTNQDLTKLFRNYVSLHKI